MGSFSIYHIALIALVVIVLFGGKGRLSDTMGDFAKGLKSFRKGLSEEIDEPAPPNKVPAEPVSR